MKLHCLTGFSAALLLGTALSAQPVISAKSGTISKVDGAVFLNDNALQDSITRFQDIKENGVVRTEDGRTEVLLPPGYFFRMGENAAMKMLSNRLIDTRVLLQSGSAVLEVDEITKDTNVTIALKDATVTFSKAGVYRFDSEPAQIKVFQGLASVEMNGETRTVSGGHLLSLADASASVQKFNTEDTDALDRWSHRRGSYTAAANASAARSLVGTGYMPTGWGSRGCSSAWGFNSYYNMMTYVPCNGSVWSPYGYQYWSPYAIYGHYWIGAPTIYGGGSGRTTVVASSSSSASLARPVATAASHSIAAAPPSATFGGRGGFGATGNGANSSGFSAASANISAGSSSPSYSSPASGGFSGASSAAASGHAGGGAAGGSGGGRH